MHIHSNRIVTLTPGGSDKTGAKNYARISVAKAK